MSLLVHIAAYAGLGGAAAAGLGWLGQRWLLFPATRHVYRTPAVYGWDYQDLLARHPNGTTHAWFIPLENARGAVIFSHGNAGNIADRLESAGLLRALGLDVLVYDYGGYGRSSGFASEQRCCHDIRAMWRWLTEQRGIAPNRIVLFGRSLGGGPTGQLAAEVTPAAVILESTFASIPSLARDLFPGVPCVERLACAQFNTRDKAPSFTAPFLCVHSPDDTLIPFHHGQAIFENAPEPKHFLEIHGEHNEGFVLSMQTWLDGLDAFLTPLLGPNPYTGPRPTPEGPGK